MFLIENLVHKLLGKMTRYLVSFIKVPVLLKISSEKTKLCRYYFTKNSILYVVRVLDTRLVKLSVHTFNIFTSFVFLGNCWHKQKQPLELL